MTPNQCALCGGRGFLPGPAEDPGATQPCQLCEPGFKPRFNAGDRVRYVGQPSNFDRVGTVVDVKNPHSFYVYVRWADDPASHAAPYRPQQLEHLSVVDRIAELDK